MKKYANGVPKFEYIGGNQWNLPFIGDLGLEDSDIGFEMKKDVLWFYQTQGLEDGLNWKEMKALGEVLLEMSEQAKRFSE